MDDELDLGEPVLVDFEKHPIWIGGAKAARRDLLDALEAEIRKELNPIHMPPSVRQTAKWLTEKVLAIIAKHREEA